MVEEFYKALRYALKDIAIFPNENLKDILYYALLVSVLSTICELFNLFPFLNPIGAWLGTGILLIAYLYSGGRFKRKETN